MNVPNTRGKVAFRFAAMVDGDLVIGIRKLADHMAADKARASDDEYTHHTTLEQDELLRGRSEELRLAVVIPSLAPHLLQESAR